MNHTALKHNIRSYSVLIIFDCVYDGGALKLGFVCRKMCDSKSNWNINWSHEVVWMLFKPELIRPNKMASEDETFIHLFCGIMLMHYSYTRIRIVKYKYTDFTNMQKQKKNVCKQMQAMARVWERERENISGNCRDLQARQMCKTESVWKSYSQPQNPNVCLCVCVKR